MHRFVLSMLALVLAVPVQAADGARQGGPRGDPPPLSNLLDVVPANAVFVVGASGLKPFTDKLDKLITQVDPAQAGIGAIVALAAGQFGLGTSLDHNAPMAFVMASPRDVLGKAIAAEADSNKLLVGIVGYLDDQKLAKDLNIDPQQLQPGKFIPWKHDNFPVQMQVLAQDKRLYIATNEKAIQSVRNGKRLREDLTREHARTLSQADALVVVSPQGMGDEWATGIQLLRQQLPKPGPDNDNLAGEIIELLEKLRFLAIGVRMDGGVGINTIAIFPQDPKVAAILGKLSKGTSSSLAGLPVPAGSLLFAQGAVGDGKETSALTRLLTAIETPGGVGLHSLFAKADQPAMQAVFASLWKQLRGDRLAVYQTKNPRAGQLAALAILDADDPTAFVDEVRKVIRLGNPNELKLNEPGPRDDRALIERLIKDLGSDDFDVREKATTALTVIGRPALPYLEEALKSPDAEIARRAKDLATDIKQGAAEKRTDLLSGRLPYQVPPTLLYFPTVEKRLGLDVDMIQIKLDPKDEGLIPKLRELLGPDWNKVRVLRRAKQVIVLFGSDLALLEEALGNLTRSAPGLAKWDTLKEFQANSDPGRKLEAHYSLVRYLALTNPAADNHFKDADKAGVTSGSFSAAPDRLQLDLWMPVTELRGMVFLFQEQQKHAGGQPGQ
jgi:hypothetical protein